MEFDGTIPELYGGMSSITYLRVSKSFGGFPSDFHLQSPLTEYLYMNARKPELGDAKIGILEGLSNLVELDIWFVLKT